MATYGVRRAKHATLTTTTVDTVTLTDDRLQMVNVYNRSGSADLTVTVGASGAAATPVALADDTFLIPAGMALTIATGGHNDATEVKVLGNGNGYSVQALQ